MNLVAIVTARGGSKGIPRKNLRKLSGRPLLLYAIDAARKSHSVDEVVVSSDDDEILDLARGAGAVGLRRPQELSTDDASSEDAIYHALTHLPSSMPAPSHFALLQPTSPLRSSEDIDAAARLLDDAGNRSVISVTESEHHPYKALIEGDSGFEPVSALRHLSSPRQALPRSVRPNGAIYMGSVPSFLETRSLWTQPVFLEMPAERSIDLDSELDWRLAELLLDSGTGADD